MGLLGMVEATIEDLAITIRSSRATIWGRPHIVGEAVLSTTKICTGAKPFLKTHLESFEIMGTRMLLREERIAANNPG
jgi:hypothetical protein